MFRRSDCPKGGADWNWLELNGLFPKRRMYITMALRMDSIRMDTQPAGDWRHESPHPVNSTDVR